MAAGSSSFVTKLLPFAFVAVASSASLEWVSGSARGEIARYQQSRQQLAEFSHLIAKYEAARPADRPVVAKALVGQAALLPKLGKDEAYKSASNRVVALTSWVAAPQASDELLRNRLRAEVNGLSSEIENSESELSARANRSEEMNRWLLAITAGVSGVLLVRSRSTAESATA